MQAVILAAGRGSRLGQKGDQRPKCLLELDRRPLVEYQLEALADAGIAPVAMVVGYCADEIRQVVGVGAEYIENPRWSTTNSVYSFWLARDWVKGPVLVLNADTIFHPEVLDRLLDQEGDAFAYDSESGQAREQMKVRLVDDRLIEMRKDLPIEHSSGENVGILKFTETTARALFETTGKLIEEGQEQCWLGSGVQLLARTHHLHAVDVAGLPWGEIDSGYDLARVRKEIVPAVRSGTRSRYPARRRARWAGVALASLLPMYAAGHLWWTGQARAWESVEMTGAPQAVISKDTLQQTWWALEDGEKVRAMVTGPGKVRVDSRLILGAGTQGRSPYVIEIRRDGTRLGWFKHAQEASATWKQGESPVARRTSIDVDIPAGSHSLEIRLVASDSGRGLVRLRRHALEDEDRAD